MSREVRFSFDSEEQKAEFEAYAKGKGMSLSGLSKMAVFQYKAKYALSEAQKAGIKRGRGRPPKENNTVQS